MDARLPAHVEISGIIRAVEADGGFAMVLSKGERDAGVILIITRERDKNARLWERMPQLDGSRTFICSKEEDIENPSEFSDYCARRTTQDPDTWLLELEVANPERFIPEVNT